MSVMCLAGWALPLTLQFFSASGGEEKLSARDEWVKFHIRNQLGALANLSPGAELLCV